MEFSVRIKEQDMTGGRDALMPSPEILKLSSCSANKQQNWTWGWNGSPRYQQLLGCSLRIIQIVLFPWRSWEQKMCSIGHRFGSTEMFSFVPEVPGPEFLLCIRRQLTCSRVLGAQSSVKPSLVVEGRRVPCLIFQRDLAVITAILLCGSRGPCWRLRLDADGWPWVGGQCEGGALPWSVHMLCAVSSLPLTLCVLTWSP